VAASSKEPFCKQKQHRKVLDKGVPEDVMPGIKNTKVSVQVINTYFSKYTREMSHP
jgi:hypothetical protein